MLLTEREVQTWPAAVYDEAGTKDSKTPGQEQKSISVITRI
jgi:hypothetical protein